MTAKTIVKNEPRNSILDRAFQGLSGGFLMFLAVHDLVPHIKATEPMNWALASAAVGLLLYLVFAPVFRTNK